MKEEFLKRPRMSRIFWNGKFLKYPLDGKDVMRQLGPVELVRSGLSYLWAAITPKGKEENLEQWVSNRFGKRLYQHFFKVYTEKVWGVPTTELRAEWAAQRIKGLSFFSAAKAAFFGNKGNKIKSLIEEFHYPRFGPGQMWETMADEIIANGGEVRLNTPVEKLEVRDGRVVAIEAGGERIEPSDVISSLPLRATVGMAGAAASGEVQARRPGPALPRLPHRRADHRRRGPVPGHVDLHPRPGGPGRADPELPRLEPLDGPGREQGLRRHGVLLLPGRRALGDGRRRARRAGPPRARAARPGRPGKVEKGYVTRVPLAYPMYDPDYKDRVDAIRTLARDARQPPAGRPQRAAPLQQLRPLDAHRHPRGGQRGQRHRARPVGRQRRVRLPRDQEEAEQPYRRAPETKAMREPLVASRRA